MSKKPTYEELLKRVKQLEKNVEESRRVAKDLEQEERFSETVLDSLTVDNLLHELSTRYGDDFRKIIFDPETHVLSRDIRILVNGRHYSHLPGKLDTQLHEGDEVSLFPPIAGG